MLTHTELMRLMSYDQSCGVLRWRISLGRARAGAEVGSTDPRGYRRVTIHGICYWVHRLIWFCVYGVWPSKHIDHINHDKSDNRIENLRDVSRSVNQRNRKNAVTGVKLHKKSGWRAIGKIEGREIGLGYYQDWFDAVCARKSWEAANPLPKGD